MPGARKGSFTVAIDGPAAAGKGTIARAVAAHFGFAYLDTGLLYRAVARRVLAGDDPVQAAENLSNEELSGSDLRTPEISREAAQVAVIAEVRAALLAYQRDFARRAGGAVLDGRDIGTVICPEAEVKLFVTASDVVRAQRRFDELLGKGSAVSLAQVRRDLQRRDARDSGRDIAPTRRATDAVLLDTTELSISDAVRVAVDLVRDVYSRGPDGGARIRG